MKTLAICAGFAIALAMLAGCGGSQVAPTSVTGAASASHGKSWMKPGSSSSDLLYIEGGCFGICIVSYPSGKYVGNIITATAGFLCSDSNGDVFLPVGQSEGAGYIYEYAHGGTTPIATLTDTGFPNGCSVDPTTGNLAVANYFAPGSQYGHGNVAIYTNAQGTPTYYDDPNVYWYEFCSYDNNGNLLVDGNSESKTVPFAMLPRGSSKFTDITLNKDNNGELGPIQWDGQYFAVLDYRSAAIYQISVSGSNGNIVGETQLRSKRAIKRIDGAFWIQDGIVMVSFQPQGRHAGYVGFWKYPIGGNPTRVLKRVNGQKISPPPSITVSVTPKR